MTEQEMKLVTEHRLAIMKIAIVSIVCIALVSIALTLCMSMSYTNTIASIYDYEYSNQITNTMINEGD